MEKVHGDAPGATPATQNSRTTSKDSYQRRRKYRACHAKRFCVAVLAALHAAAVSRGRRGTWCIYSFQVSCIPRRVSLPGAVSMMPMRPNFCAWGAWTLAFVPTACGLSWTVVNDDTDVTGNPTNVGEYAMVTTADRNRIWFYDGNGQTDEEIFYMDVSGASGFSWVQLSVDNTNGPGDQWSLSAAMASNNVIWIYGGNAGSQDVYTIDVSAVDSSTTEVTVVLKAANDRPDAPGFVGAQQEKSMLLWKCHCNGLD
eukprot:s3310_g8.t2